MIDIKQLDKYVVSPVLDTLGLNSLAARQLIIGTAMAESRLEYLHQLGGGPALGIYQMEPNTHDDIWEHYLAYRTALGDKVASFSWMDESASEMIGNLYYATAMCRMHYLRVPEKLPDAGNAAAMAIYHKNFYNTILGDADPAKNEILFQQVIDEMKG